jgi:D-inositol-3-phosphate glycosyltransferase
VPFIQMFHTLGKMKERVARSPAEGKLDQRIEAERMLMTKADRVVAATEAELAQFQWLYKADIDRVRVIPPGVDTTRFYPIPRDEAKEFVGIELDNKMILFVGRLEPLKGIDTLLRAIAQLHSNGDIEPECQCLVVIGGDSESSDPTSEIERLKSISAELGMQDLVAFIGSRDQDKLPYYYSAAEVIVVPSQYESFGLVALEAMACGRPVVASETGGLVFLVKDGETGFHVPAADPDALAGKLRLLLHDQGLRRQFGENARRYASVYAWPKITEAIVELYEDVLAEQAVAAG